MKSSFAIALLLSNASLFQAMRLNERTKFMPDLDDDNELIRSVSKKTSLNSDNEEQIEMVAQKEQDQLRRNRLI